jgi:MFS transporter, CP family, cyanate transporter
VPGIIMRYYMQKVCLTRDFSFLLRQNKSINLTKDTLQFKSPTSLDSKLSDSLKPSQMRYRWVMLTLVSLLYFGFGCVLSSTSPLVTPIVRDLGLSYSQMGFILGTWQLVYVGVSAFSGAMMDKFGLRKTLLIGIILVFLSEALRFFANGFGMMVFCVALFGLGGPMISIGCPKAIAQWFGDKERGKAVGIYMAASSGGMLFALSTANSVWMPLIGNNWRLTFVLLSLPALIAMIFWWFMSKDIKAEGIKQGQNILKVFTDLGKVRNVMLVLLMAILYFTTSLGFSSWMPQILETGGLHPTVAGYMASISMLFSIPSVIIIPRLVSARWRNRIVASFALLGGLSMVMAVIIKGFPLVFFLILYGITSLTIVTFLTLILMDVPEVGSKYMGSATGLFYTFAEIGGFSGPLLIGALKDRTGSFMEAAILMLIISFAVGTMALFIKTRTKSNTEIVR